MGRKAEILAESKALKGVILAAGRGIRAYPATRFMPKTLLDVGGKTLIERNIEIMRDQLGIHDIIIVVGYMGNQVIKFLSGKYNDLNLKFVYQRELKGIGHALLAVEALVGNKPFFVILGDEFYLHTNHRQLKDFNQDKTDAVLMFIEERNKSKISNNFTAKIQDSKIISLNEKPKDPESSLMGVGSYFFPNQKIFDYIKNAQTSILRGEIENTNVLSHMAQKENVYCCILNATYINVNSIDDLNMANYILREAFFDKYKVSVVIPAFNEQDCIQYVIEDFKNQKTVHEILVVDNNSKDRTNELAVQAGAMVIKEPDQGYGCAIRRGLDEAQGDIIVMAEADGSFQARDIEKLTNYLKDCDMVVGTRTTRQMIEQGTNMLGLLRWGNVFVGKLIEILWWNQEPRFTDVGCTYRAIWKTSYEKIRPYLRGIGPEFSPEMMIAILICRGRIIEIPVSYRKRLGGQSKHSGHFKAHLKTASKMLRLIFRYRMRY